MNTFTILSVMLLACSSCISVLFAGPIRDEHTVGSVLNNIADHCGFVPGEPESTETTLNDTCGDHEMNIQLVLAAVNLSWTKRRNDPYMCNFISTPVDDNQTQCYSAELDKHHFRRLFESYLAIEHISRNGPHIDADVKNVYQSVLKEMKDFFCAMQCLDRINGFTDEDLHPNETSVNLPALSNSTDLRNAECIGLKNLQKHVESYEKYLKFEQHC